MPDVYCASVVSELSVVIDSLTIEITASPNKTVKIKRIRVMHGGGSETLTSDYHRNIKLVFESVAGTGGNVFNPVKMDPNSNPSTSSVIVGAFKPGTISDTLDSLSVHSATDYNWAAADEDDKITLAPGGIFGIILNVATT